MGLSKISSFTTLLIEPCFLSRMGETESDLSLFLRTISTSLL